jgi:EmrB/QacA subfamily drug resistance transporter
MSASLAHSGPRLTASQPADSLDPRRWWALSVVLTATFLSLFDLFVVNVAAPSIEHDLHATAAALQLVIAGYSFTYAIGLITGGRLGDLFGSRKLFLLGMLVFTIASLGCGIAPNPPVLVVARLFQSAGAALMVPQVLAFVQALFPLAERPRAFAFFGAVAGAGAIAGQVLGGLLLAADPFGLGWRAVFLIQLPIGAASLAAGWWLLPAPAGRSSSAGAPGRRFDLLGTLLFTLGLAAVLIPLIIGRQAGWPSWSFVCLGGAVAVLGGFVAHQRARVAAGAVPLLAPRLFTDRAFSLGLVINLAFYAELGSFFLIITLFLQDGLGLSPLTAGLTFASLGVGFVIGSSFLARRLAVRHGQRLLVVGVSLVLVTLAAAAAMVAAGGTRVTPYQLAPAMLLVGLGNGLVLPTLLNVVLAGVAPDLAGAASGVLVTMQQVGTTLGVAGIGTLFFARLGGGTYTSATVTALIADAALILLTWVLIETLLRAGARRQTRAIA